MVTLGHCTCAFVFVENGSLVTPTCSLPSQQSIVDIVGIQQCSQTLVKYIDFIICFVRGCQFQIGLLLSTTNTITIE